MIPWYHLLWIVPVASAFGFIACAIFAVGADADRKDGN